MKTVLPARNDRADDTYAVDADAVLTALAAEYPAYASADVADMKQILTRLNRNEGAGPADIEALHAIAHNVKGQGACFGYDLITVFGEALCLHLRDRHRIAPAELASITRLIDACEIVLGNKLTNDGGAMGAALLLRSGLARP